MDVMGHGKPADLAARAKPGLDLIGKGASRAPAAPKATASPAASRLDTGKIAEITGQQGEQTGAVYKITVGRSDINLKEMGAVINARMGLNT